MKKNYPYLILLLSFGIFTIFILFYRKPESDFELKMRGGELAASSEWLNTKAAIENLMQKVRSNPGDIKSKTELGFAYIQEGRITGNHVYYDQASLTLFDDVLKREKDNYLALVGKATVLLSQHHFADALPVATLAKAQNPYNSSAYGILTDAYVELGNYNEAILMADSMVAIRPDLRSYSRISYLREILGNDSGAISAMKMAVEAGYPGSEQTEWCRTQLGQLYENSGDLIKAQFCYDQSIYYRPSFSWAYAGKARIERARKNYGHAIQYTKQAQSLLDDFSFQQQLTELYRITNQQILASASARRTIELLDGIQGNENKKNHGHYADRELSMAFIDAYDYIKANKHALIEYNRRPENIDANLTLAWTYYKLGKYDVANNYITHALKTHSNNPVLNYKAGLIKIKAGYLSEGRSLINKSNKLCPNISPLLKEENGFNDNVTYSQR